MANTGQIVAALAGGALLAVATMLVLRLRALERRAEQQRRIDTAVSAIVTGVAAFRLDWPPDAATPAERGTAAETPPRAHLRLIATPPATKRSGRRDSPAPARGSAGPRSRELRSHRR